MAAGQPLLSLSPLPQCQPWGLHQYIFTSALLVVLLSTPGSIPLGCHAMDSRFNGTSTAGIGMTPKPSNTQGTGAQTDVDDRTTITSDYQQVSSSPHPNFSLPFQEEHTKTLNQTFAPSVEKLDFNSTPTFHLHDSKIVDGQPTLGTIENTTSFIEISSTSAQHIERTTQDFELSTPSTIDSWMSVRENISSHISTSDFKNNSTALNNLLGDYNNSVTSEYSEYTSNWSRSTTTIQEKPDISGEVDEAFTSLYQTNPAPSFIPDISHLQTNQDLFQVDYNNHSATDSTPFPDMSSSIQALDNLTYFRDNYTFNASEPGLGTGDKVHSISPQDLLYLRIAEFTITSVGVVGNTIILIVVLGKRFRGSAFGFHLLCLSTFDSGTLITQCILNQLSFTATNSILCKILSYINETCEISSSWTLVIIAFERVSAVKTPFISVVRNTRCRAIICQFSVSLLMAALTTPVYLFAHIKEEDGQLSCFLGGPTDRTAFVPHLAYHLLLYSFIPTCFLVVLNAIVIAALRRSTELRRSASSTLSRSNVQVESLNKNARLSIILIATSLIYAMTTLPASVGLTVKDIKDGFGFNEQDGEGLLFLWLYKLHKLNHAANFFVYTITGSEFRAGIRDIYTVVLYIWKKLTGGH